MCVLVYFIMWLVSTLIMGVLHKKGVWIFKDWKPSGTSVVNVGADDGPPHLFVSFFWPIILFVGCGWCFLYGLYKLCNYVVVYISDSIGGSK